MELSAHGGPGIGNPDWVRGGPAGAGGHWGERWEAAALPEMMKWRSLVVHSSAVVPSSPLVV